MFESGSPFLVYSGLTDQHITASQYDITKENIERLADLGVDYISSGALTHSAPILDLSLKNLHPTA